ncbi:hypothetical protein C5167_008835 [Papaver somniferum]|uniref:Uncharacterized protein n=1 Tax=Papaver somniferum TaxID=3469 RepID=A0A4Y7JX45_PAPSO|nr:hypothetical protein C5167_008835 [Papaver somniferum]
MYIGAEGTFKSARFLHIAVLIFGLILFAQPKSCHEWNWRLCECTPNRDHLSNRRGLTLVDGVEAKIQNHTMNGMSGYMNIPPIETI